MANISEIIFQSLTPQSVVSTGRLITFPYYSDKVQAAGYYGQTEPMNTVQYATVSGFNGIIQLQGSLATDPQDIDWYDIVGINLGDGITPVANGTVTQNFGGNHVWVRGVIKVFSAGEINNVLLNHN